MPPFTGVAVNATLLPVHTEVTDEVILTEGVTEEVTVIVIALLVAVGVVAQSALLVITRVTTSLLFNADEEKVLLLVPTLLPFILH